MKAKLASGNVDELMRRTGLIYYMCNEVMNTIRMATKVMPENVMGQCAATWLGKYIL